jgi:small subunit ribosomal protein S1
MVTEYDEQGNYKFPEGFDATSGEWLEGFDTQREAWEAEYAAAQVRWEAHKKQILAAEETDAQLDDGPRAGASGSSFSSDAPSSAGALADDEQLAALREKLSSTN